MNNTTIKQIGMALLTAAVYTFLFNWKVAILLCIGISWHEYSHMLAAKSIGLRTKGFVLIPFVGGISFIVNPCATRLQTAYIAIAGPFGGFVSALLSLGIYALTGWVGFLQASMALAIFNGFNLIPLATFMDGSQILGSIFQSISRTAGMIFTVVVGVVGTIVLYRIAPIFCSLVIFFGGAQLFREISNWWDYRAGRRYLCSEAYLKPPAAMNRREMWLAALCYVSLLASIGLFILLVGYLPNSNYILLFKK